MPIIDWLVLGISVFFILGWIYMGTRVDHRYETTTNPVVGRVIGFVTIAPAIYWKIVLPILCAAAFYLNEKWWDAVLNVAIITLSWFLCLIGSIADHDDDKSD